MIIRITVILQTLSVSRR